MSKKLALAVFRAVRSKLEPHEFAISEGQDVPPSDLIEKNIWDGIMHLPEDVSIRISDHNGTRLRLMHGLGRGYRRSTRPDEIFNCLLDAGDCFQCANFNFVHGFYRAAIAESRTGLELVMIGAYGSLNPSNKDYVEWKAGKAADLTFLSLFF